MTGTDRTLDELGYYLLAGAGGEGPATLMDEARRGEELAQSFARNPNLNQAKSPADGLDKPEPFQMKVQRPHALVLYPDQRMEIPFQGCNS